MNFTYGL